MRDAFVAIRTAQIAVMLLLSAATLIACGGKKEQVGPEAPIAAPTTTSDPAKSPPGASSDSERKSTINDLDPITLAYPPSGIVLGQAYDYVAQRWLPSVCVAGKAVALGAGEMTVKLKDLQDRQQIFESLKLTVSGEGSIGAGSVSASADYARSTEIKTERRNLLATVDSMKGGEQLAPADGALAVVLSKPGLDKANDKSSAARSPFRTACGDGYVAAIRRGARLSGVLSYVMDATDMQESLKISGSGGYGLAKAKASMERVRKDDKNSMNTEMSILQVGGNRSLNPATPQEFVQKMGKFGEYTVEEAVPLEVVVLPYRVLGDIPASVRERPLPDLGVRGLATHYWRLSDLSALYARASMNRGAYYHPFVPPEQLVSKARTLQNAALCVSEMLNICTVDSTEEACSLKTLTARARVRQVCLQSEPQATLGERIESVELAVGSVSAQMLLTEDSIFKEGDGARALQRWKENLKSTAALPAVPASAVSGAATKAAPHVASLANWNTNTYDLWFRSYARAPWPRQVNSGNTGLEGSDMNLMLGAFCTARRLSCKSVEYAQLSAATPIETASRDALFREFVVVSRLFPVAAAVCESQLSHPMCQLPDVLYYYVSDQAGDMPLKFGAEREFRALTELVLPVAQQPRQPKPPREHYGCQTHPGGPGYPC
jgi:hypothetical protein